MGLLRKDEFISEAEGFTYYDVQGRESVVELPSNSLAFTIAQVPVVYHLSEEKKVLITLAKNKTITIAGNTLDEENSSSVFNRKGEITRNRCLFEKLIVLPSKEILKIY